MPGLQASRLRAEERALAGGAPGGRHPPALLGGAHQGGHGGRGLSCPSPLSALSAITRTQLADTGWPAGPDGLAT